ncbi:MAG: 50S ribosomal protein L23 [Firmicutes bacterium]|nr:50S ribosomal protein L23 [Bacillota bacterium]MBQ1523740.1 50S ribosomal protein L23 [Bacillota bacterium]MBQ1887909.1 50S ribosomal protein L23 [Bacillota bacterium]MBQ2455684.1 50S ribosomal protein L23 [Bacillota bacterium]MBQ3577583.1 50S ribosomal protein L23 [Bacillota bacterium]
MKTAYDIIKCPLVSEKSMDDAQERKYTFKVDVKATKTQIKAAVEEAFGVEVVRVNTVNYDGKMKRQGVTQGRTPAYKKAIVFISENSKTIEFFEGL